MKNLACLVIVFLLSFWVVQAQRLVPGKKQSQSILISNGTYHLGNGNIIENGFMLFDEGKITFIGTQNLEVPQDTQIIDASGKHIYPGLILLNSVLGLREIGSIRATRDYYELEDFSPNVRALIAFNTDSDIIPTLRSNGVLIAQIRPYGGMLPGRSSVVHLDGWNWEDAVITADNGLHLEWPKYITNTGSWINPKEDEINSKYHDKVEQIYTWFREAKAYCLNVEANTERDVNIESMCGVFKGMRLYVSASEEKEIVDCIDFFNEFEFAHKILLGAKDAHLLVDKLKEKNISVVMDGPFSIPSNAHDDYDLNYKMILPLIEKDILVSINHVGSDFSSMRNLPFLAGHLVGFGLDKEKALQLITLNAAKIAGIDNNYGILQKGKSATFLIAEGDILDIKTSQVSWAFVDGRSVDLNNKHKMLYKTFQKRYEKE